MNRRIFPDINNYTLRFQAHHVATAGAQLVGILCVDGRDYYSPTHAQQADQAHDAGLSVWHYLFARPERNPTGAGEPSHLWAHARPHYQPGDRLILDIERMHPHGPTGLITYTHHLDQTLHALTDIPPVIYMPDSLFRQLGPTLQTHANEFWIASWGATVRPLGHGRRMIAQQISNGQEGTRPYTYPGIGACDTNRLQLWYLRHLLRHQHQHR
jgi:hypothetical protein